MSLEAPTPERFGLTQDRISYFKKNLSHSSIPLISVAANFLICGFIFTVVFPKSGIPFLLFLFLALFPGFTVGGSIEEHRIAKIKKLLDYPNLLKYEEALKAYNELCRKIRREEARKRREMEYRMRKEEESWRGMDGRSFELEVAKLLMNKGYIVKHTGSNWGDRGVDLLLKIDEKTIIVQCKAFKNYLSAGVVRELYGTLIDQKADEAWLVTTSGFYRGAKEFAHGKPIRLLTMRNLMNLPNLLGKVDEARNS
jgi:hypothetical protein